ncbi:electron transfer flavoprotein subunit beta/FixA family protein [Paenibacillus pseudetheri]|uniref:Electron transfer flavoprotein small subunit n=1 Tax=Paenibacillus pseudetheri TaxID=2897682 RepID=A0ABN8FV24_9BACL|nr:hypothetical protein [Paenibacillus pseudetheri]CAH1059810.1 Caffeyl-CoA reductase-Etf complex subunit CarD [Paenibacillus pseudetheri]
MRIICLVKFVPDVDSFVYDYESNVLVREKAKMIINPDDACALAFALALKASRSNVFIEVVTMGPRSVQPLMKDLLRRHVDRGTLITDKAFVGSDTYVTATILGRYLEKAEYDFILTGTNALDGDTAHVPLEVAEYLQLPQINGITRFNENSSFEESAEFEVAYDNVISTFEMDLPAVLSVSRVSIYKLPFVRFHDLNMDVDDRLNIVTNEELQFLSHEVGLRGSPTKVAKTFTKALEAKETKFVETDDEGIEIVYQFLNTKGFVQDE